MGGPLEGVRIIELAGIGALPFGTLKLADMGAEVIRVDRVSEVPDDPTPRPHSVFERGRRSIAVDLKHPRGVETVLRLAEDADALVESMRPGVAERLGVGPEEVMARNPRLVYGRITGWGRDGPLADSAAHALNYDAVTGAVWAIGDPDAPPAPLLQVLADFGGGGLLLAYGLVCALFEAQRSGKGQVVDAAMIDGVASLLQVFYLMADSGMHTPARGTNLFDGGAPFYAVYECSDGGYVSVAAIEPQFWSLLLEKIGLHESELPNRDDRDNWPELKGRLADAFATRTRREWTDLLEGTDSCFAPVLRLDEVRDHPHHVARGTFARGAELAPSPRLDRTPGEIKPSTDWPGADTDAVLAEAGFSKDELAGLREAGAIR